MIGQISGVVRERQPPWLLVEVGGVGYELEAPMTTFYSLPPVGESVVLHTHQMMRDDVPCLYGFIRRADRDAFRQLLRVSGVGGKVALALLSGLDAQQLARCVRAGDAAGLARIPGIGKKTAARLLLELRDRLPGAGGAVEADFAGDGAAVPKDPESEAIAAMVALGFPPQEAARRVSAVAAEVEGGDSEQIVRAALRSVIPA